MATEPRRRSLPIWFLVSAAIGLVVIATVTGVVMAVLGGEISCVGGGSAQAAPPSKSAKKEISPERLRLYQQAGRRYDVDWTFLASIGTQECGSGEDICTGINSSGCGGPMQIAYVRGSACSPDPSAPTLWERYGVDADGDGKANINSLADSIFTAARFLKPVMGAPRTGGSYAEYRQAACNYYGACSDGLVSYADEVMARAVQYGFKGPGSPPPTDPDGAQPAPPPSGGCSGSVGVGSGPMGPVEKLFEPRKLAPLPPVAAAYPGILCDARIVDDVVYFARRFGIIVTSCYSGSGHEATGEHPLGAAIDASPRDGDWSRTMRLALAIGWKPSCALSGAAPVCAKPPFRWIGYNGYPSHGDPIHCVPCSGGPHIHISWHTSASPGEPENAARYGYEPATWIESFSTTGTTSTRPRSEGK